MRAKVIVLIIAIAVILGVSLYASNLKEGLQKKIVSEVEEYSCGEGGLCNSCIIEGHECSCGRRVCSCGNKTVNASECEFI